MKFNLLNFNNCRGPFKLTVEFPCYALSVSVQMHKSFTKKKKKMPAFVLSVMVRSIDVLEH